MPDFKDRFIAARRAYIESDFAALNEMQRSAVMATEGPLLLLAGAGSGKTTVLISRIFNLIKYGRGSDTSEIPDRVTEEDTAFLENLPAQPGDADTARAVSLCAVEPAEPWRVIAITFTNKAADVLKSRLRSMMGEAASDIWAMTFHSACVRILRRDIDKLGYESSFVIYDTTDSTSVIKRILKDGNIDDKQFSPKSILSVISKSKDQQLSADDFLAQAEKSADIRRKIIGSVYLEYTKHLAAANALDFDDLLLMTVKLLTEFPAVRDYYRKRFKYVLIDEYQDTNSLQYHFASALAGGHKNICVVGDDDQSIYKFRGATIENILNFENQYKDARVIRMEQNYRSTSHIIDGANNVISRNKGRKGKTLWTAKGEGEKIVLHKASSEQDEAHFVADTIINSVTGGAKFSSHAVLYRMNAQSGQFEYSFKRGGVPYKIIGGTGFFERAEVKDMLAYLCVLLNPNDDLRLTRIINNPPRAIGQKTIDTLAETASSTGRSLFETIKDSAAFEQLEKSAAKLHVFADLIDELREKAAEIPLPDLYDLLLLRTGYLRLLESKQTDENISRAENVRELKTNILTFMHENENGTLADFLSEISLFTDLDKYDSSDDRVVLMTMHSAKGLEFDTVFIVGAEEGVFPGIRAIGEPEELEEERRLCYVAMTRARKQLYFICAGRRMLFGKTNMNPLSRFVEEVAEEHIERHETFSAYGGYVSPFASVKTRQESAWSNNSPADATHPKLEPAASRPKLSAKPPAPFVLSFKKGDSITHKAFGRGLITNITPTGGDALIEVAFETSGTKRLMAKSAAQYMSAYT